MAVENLTYCKNKVIEYVDNGLYYAECQYKINEAQSILSKRIGVPNLTVVLDIDDTAISFYDYWKKVDFGGTNATVTASFYLEYEPELPPVKAFYDYCIKNNVNIIFLTGRREKYRTPTLQLLKNAGYVTFMGLDMKPDNSQLNDAEFKAEMILKYQKQGLIIAVIVGDQNTDGENTADYKCIIPNKFYDVTAYE